jgi:hypothetical protein
MPQAFLPETSIAVADRGIKMVRCEAEKVGFPMQMMTDIDESVDFASREFGLAGFKDQRLRYRLMKIATDASAGTGKSVMGFSTDSAAAKGAYRFFGNPETSVELITETHTGRTIERMRSHNHVLILQDTTSVNYNGHNSVEDIGNINTKKIPILGVFVHPQLAVSTSGMPLGLLSYLTWTREETTGHKKPLEFEERESRRWADAVETAVNLKPQLPTTRTTIVADREGDIYEVFAAGCDQGVDLLIRAKHNRTVNDNDDRLFEYMKSQPSAGTSYVEVQGNVGRTGRTATVEIRYSAIELPPPDSSRHHKTYDLFAVHVREVGDLPPRKDGSAETPLEWMLLTTHKISGFDHANEIVSWYRQRWMIETYFKVLKSGCKIEDCKLGTFDRLQKFIALMLIMAYKVLATTHFARHSPNAPATEILTPKEIETLRISTLAPTERALAQAALSEAKRKAKTTSRQPKQESFVKLTTHSSVSVRPSPTTIEKVATTDSEMTIQQAVHRLGALAGGFYATILRPNPGMQSVWTGLSALGLIMASDQMRAFNSIKNPNAEMKTVKH